MKQTASSTSYTAHAMIREPHKEAMHTACTCRTAQYFRQTGCAWALCVVHRVKRHINQGAHQMGDDAGGGGLDVNADRMHLRHVRGEKGSGLD